MPGSSKVRLTLPRQDLAEFSLFRPNAEAAMHWATSLPVTRPRTVAQLLSHVLGELNRVTLRPETRYAVLEALRPSLDVALASLGRRFLNQPLVMPREPQGMADLTDQLLSLSGTAYSLVAVEAIEQRDAIRDVNPARLACEAIQRGLYYHGRRALQAFQLYRPLPIHGWQVLHHLYALAEHQTLSLLPVPDPLAGGETIKSTYLQAIMLGCCKPNQLRQGELATVYAALCKWTGQVELVRTDAGTGLFIVDLDSDQPPLYSALYPGDNAPGPSCRNINTAVLIEHLYQRKAAFSGKHPKQSSADGVPEHLIDHLITSLGNMSVRNFQRVSSDAPLRVCLGLTGAHYHIAGQREFHSLLSASPYLSDEVAPAAQNPFLPDRQEADAWSEANPHSDFVRNEWLPGQGASADAEHRMDLDDRTRAQVLEEVQVELPLDQRYPVVEVRLADASPGGYCLEWTRELPGEVRAGDIVSLMEEQSRDWSIAVIRWLRRLEDSRTLIGLELLSPRANAYVAVLQRYDGRNSSPLRALLLPEIKLVGQAQTLVVPRASFRERQKITLVNGEDLQTVRLVRQVAATASYTQFEFRYIQELGDVLARERQDYDSLWSNI